MSAIPAWLVVKNALGEIRPTHAKLGERQAVWGVKFTVGRSILGRPDETRSGRVNEVCGDSDEQALG
ncbi:MAG: hypothetical protein ACOH2K_15470, partial [Burkholderiaceae bacterium]